MNEFRDSRIISEDPAAMTLSEALSEAPSQPTFLWGDGIVATAMHCVKAGVPTRAFSSDVTTARAVEALGVACEVGTIPADVSESRIAVRMPRAKRVLDLMVRVASSSLPEQGEFWVAGHNRDGIKSVVGVLERCLGPVTVLRTKRRCRVLVARRDVSIPSGDAVSLDEVASSFDVPTERGALKCVTLPGVFSHGRLDEGSRQLIRALEGVRLRRRILDFGCGCGVLGAAVATMAPEANVEMWDISAYAHWAAQRTITINAIENATAHLGDVTDIPQGTSADFVISNPPFHVGRLEDRGLASHFVKEAARCIGTRGELYLVANGHLPYAAVLKHYFRRVDQVAGDGRFKVWRGCR